jgi:transposase
MAAVIDSLTRGVPTTLSELVTLGRTLKKRADDVPAFLDLPGTSNGPTEAINGRLEHLLEAGGFRTRLHPQIG